MALYLSSAPLAIIVDNPCVSIASPFTLKKIYLYCLVHRNISVEVQRERGLKHVCLRDTGLSIFICLCDRFISFQSYCHRISSFQSGCMNLSNVFQKMFF